MNDPSPEPGPSRQLLEKLRELVARAKTGDSTVLPALREFLASKRQFWRQASDLAQHAIAVQLDLNCGPDEQARQALMARLKVLKTELTGSSSSILENLLIDRIIACRLQVLHADLMHAHANTADPGQAKFFEQRLDRAHRRFGFAIKQLSLVRKLLPRE